MGSGGGPFLRRAQLALVVLFAVAGCGEADGVADGASVTAYAVAPLCAEAKRELARDGAEADDVRIQLTCLPAVERAGELDLSQIGANARRASEDSAAIAFIGERTESATRFSAPILEEAGIRQYSQMSGTEAMRRILADDSYKRF